MITMTNAARAALLSLLARKEASAEEGLRISVKKGGCAGLQYAMGVEARQADDTNSGDNEARLFIAAEAVEYLKDMTLDYTLSLADSGFKVINPNAARSCGCGTSFEAKKPGDTDQLEESSEPCESEKISS